MNCGERKKLLAFFRSPSYVGFLSQLNAEDGACRAQVPVAVFGCPRVGRPQD